MPSRLPSTTTCLPSPPQEAHAALSTRETIAAARCSSDSALTSFSKLSAALPTRPDQHTAKRLYLNTTNERTPAVNTDNSNPQIYQFRIDNATENCQCMNILVTESRPRLTRDS